QVARAIWNTPAVAPTWRGDRVVTIGQRVTVRVDDVAFGGEGIARLDQFVLFVPFVVAGELVEVEVTEVKRKYARARLLNVIEPSSQRVVAPCPYFGACGGCQYQHLAYAAQLEL